MLYGGITTTDRYSVHCKQVMRQHNIGGIVMTDINELTDPIVLMAAFDRYAEA